MSSQSFKSEISQMTVFEKIVLVSMFLIVFLGLWFVFSDPTYFVDNFTAEDGVVENLTAFALALAGLIVIADIVRKSKQKAVTKFWIFCRVLFALLLIFGAGEEISWGQRIFDVSSGEFFLENNAQAETNLHNLTVGDVKLNKLIFGQLLTVGLVLYFIFLPILYKRVDKIKKLIDTFGVPVPKAYHSIAFVLAYVISIAPDISRKWEVGEMCLGFVLVAIVYQSYVNGELYIKSSHS